MQRKSYDDSVRKTTVRSVLRARIIHESSWRNLGDAWLRPTRSQACRSGVSAVAVEVIVNNAGEAGYGAQQEATNPS